MTRRRPKGVHAVRDRKGVTRHYAWRGGPNFWQSTDGIEEGSRDYLAAYVAATERRSGKTFDNVVRAFLKEALPQKAKRTQSDYKTSIFGKGGILDAFGDHPIAAMQDPRIRRKVIAWRNGFTGRWADMRVSHLAAIISWAVNEACIMHEHRLQEIPKVHKTNRADIIWTDTEIAQFVSGAPAYVGRILIAATETGLRPGDLARLKRGDFQDTPKGKRIVMPTQKRGQLAVIPTTRPVLDLYDTADLFILTTSRGTPWRHENQLGSVVRKWRDRLEVRKDLRLYDARGTAATRLLNAGATLAEIAAHMGWSVATAARMIETYARVNPAASDAVLLKLEAAR